MWGNVMLQRYHVIYDRFDLIWFLFYRFLFYYVMRSHPFHRCVCCHQRAAAEQRSSRESGEDSKQQTVALCVLCAGDWDEMEGGVQCTRFKTENEHKIMCVFCLFLWTRTQYVHMARTKLAHVQMTRWRDDSQIGPRVVPTSQLPNSNSWEMCSCSQSFPIGFPFRNVGNV